MKKLGHFEIHGEGEATFVVSHGRVLAMDEEDLIHNRTVTVLEELLEAHLQAGVELTPAYKKGFLKIADKFLKK